MYKRIVLFLLLGLVTTACNLETATPIATITVVPFPTSTEIPSTVTSTVNPTATRLKTRTIIPTITITPTPEFFSYTEEFNDQLDNWSYFLVRGVEDDMKIYTEDGKLSFEIFNEETYVYAAYKKPLYTDVRIEAQAENTGETNTNNVGLFCRYSEAGYYEFNVNSTGYYYIYYVDNSTGKYVFNQLNEQSASQSINTGKAANQYTAVCEGNTLTLIINGKEMKTVIDQSLDEGLVGVSVSTVDVWPVTVNFDWVTISRP